MKKVVILLTIIAIGAVSAQAQKFAYVDSEYILEKMPEYVTAQKQIDQISTQYQSTIEAEVKKVDQLFQTYQSQKGRLTDIQRQQREEEIINKEQAVKDLQKSYFGQDGTVTKRTETLIKPIKDKVQRAIDALAKEGGYAVIFDVAAAPGFIYTNPTYDLSNRVLEKLGIRI
ncbi:MAG: OmpH family outer membrane protein [Prevotellaceae bacterium]|jgi:outer membrane protein|nr:OmpH family outer membrane protein [Prevotellaceae bacterium]